MIYKLFVRYALSGLRIVFLRVTSKRDLYTYIGYLHSCSDEHIERVDYKVVSSAPGSDVIDFDRWAYIHFF